LKYHAYEAESLRDLFKEREAVKAVYSAQEKALLAKKEKLFRSKDKDTGKWGALNPSELASIKE